MYDKSPVLYVGIIIGVGTRDENKREYGMAHALEHMLFKGTKKRNSTHIINRLELVGGDLNAFTAKEETVVYTAIPSNFAHRAIDLLCDIVFNSTFPQVELEKEQEVIIDEINTYRDNPSELIFDEFENIVFQNTTLGHYILGSEESVKKMTPDALTRFYKRYYRSDNMVLFILGDIDIVEALSQLNYIGQKVPVHFSEEFKRKGVSVDYKGGKRVVHRKDTYQYHTIMGCPSYTLYDKRKDAMTLLANMIGGSSMNSRLNMSLREKHGLVYNVESTFTPYTDTGLFSISFGCSKENHTKAFDLVIAELEKIKSTPLSESVLSQAKRQQIGQTLLSLDNRESIFLSLGKSYLYFNKMDTLDMIIQRINSIGVDDLYEVAQEMLDTENFTYLTYK